MTNVVALAVTAAVTAVPLANPEVLEPSVLNETLHAIECGEKAVSNKAATAWAEGRKWLDEAVHGLDATAMAIKLVSLQRNDGRWFVGTNDVTTIALDMLRQVANQ